MGPFRKWLLVGVGVCALYGLQACSSGTELNPQPLPPEQGGNDPTRTPSDSDKGTGGGGTSTPTPSAADAGAPDGGDAGDAGDG